MDSLPNICTLCGRVMQARLADLLVLSLCIMWAAGAAMKVNLDDLIKAHRLESNKRGASHDNDENVIGGNPCIDFPDHPFPCKRGHQCLPFRYICDKNYDCDDGSDEDTEMCTASQRPPIEEIKEFLQKQRKWIIPNLFAGKDVGRVAHALAVSPTLKAFQKLLHMSGDELRNFKYALEAVADNHEETFEDINMPPGAWEEVKYIFNNLMENGFGV